MTALETVLLLIGCAAALDALVPQRKRGNTNPPPTYPRPAEPPAPPPVRNHRRTDMDTLTITKPQLKAALLRWEQDARDGKTITHDEADALPLEQVAAESADHLWQELGATVGTLGRTLEPAQAQQKKVS